MAKLGMLINIDKCNGCYSCFLACRDEYESNDHLPYSVSQGKEGKSWMRVTEIERGSTPKVKVDYIPVPCFQCKDAPCVSKDGSVYRRDDGIVIIDPKLSAGKKDIVSKCPYRVIQWNEKRNVPQKCTFCAHLLDQGWEEPRCVEACPDGALVFGDLDDPYSEISRQIAASKTEELHPEFSIRPNVRYIDLPKRFIAGEVMLMDNPGDCPKGITVTLAGGNKTFECRTDSFGDFEFDGLEENKKYSLRVEYKGYTVEEREVITHTDVNIGVIGLMPDKKQKTKPAEKKETAKTAKKAPAKPAKKKAVEKADKPKTAKKAVPKQVKKTVKKSAAKAVKAKAEKISKPAKKTLVKKTAKKAATPVKKKTVKKQTKQTKK